MDEEVEGGEYVCVDRGKEGCEVCVFVLAEGRRGVRGVCLCWRREGGV